MCQHCGWESTVKSTIPAILNDIDLLPEKGSDFGEGVRETLDDMKAGIEDRRHVTDAQLDAIDNMERAVGKWFT